MKIKQYSSILDIKKTLKYIEIETCNSCTRTCKWCLYGSNMFKNRPLEFLDTIYIDRVFKELNFMNFSGTIALYSINEPLLDKRISSGELIKRAKQILGKRISINIITNGDLLDLKTIDTLFLAGLDKLMVSCYDNLTFNKIVQLKLQDNRIELLDQRRYNDGEWESNRSGFLQNRTSNPYWTSPCLFPYFRTVIGWDGNVRICPHDMLGLIPLGNIKEKCLTEILTSEAYVNIRMRLEKSRQDVPACKDCNVKGSFEYALTHLNNKSEVKSILNQICKKA